MVYGIWYMVYGIWYMVYAKYEQDIWDGRSCPFTSVVINTCAYVYMYMYTYIV